MDELDVLRKKLRREMAARKEAERLLEAKALELYRANQDLQKFNESLQEEVAIKTGEIEQQKARLSIILESLQEGILVEDETRHIVLVNQEFCDIFGIPAPAPALVGQDCSQSAQQSKPLFREPEAFITIIERLLEQRALAQDIFLETVDGRILELGYIPIFRDKEYIGHLWRYQNVTEAKQAEHKIRESEEKYRGIIENMELGLMEVDRDGVITKVYDRFCLMTGYQPEELIGKNARQVFLPEEFAGVMNQQDELRYQGGASVYETQMVIKGGKRIWVMISGAPFFDDDGNQKGSIGIHYNISEQKELQRELEKARREAEKARDAEKEFLANMSHEIRNPINSIIGMAHLMYDTSLTPEQVEYLQNIKHSSDILLALISDVLDISKITEGKMELNPQEFDPTELFTALGKTIEFRLRQKPVDFQLELDAQLPERLFGDTTFLNQILLNLLGNAIKFTHEGTIALRIKLEKENASTVVLAFQVSDTGIGIAPEKLGHIFERFSQAGKAYEYGGTGLGLPITKKLIELHGGLINVKSEKGQGATFYFQIPFGKVFTNDLSEDSPKEPVEVRAGLALSILIVEDNDINRLYLERVIKKWGHQYHSCRNGREAIETLDEKVFDLILMDIRMPEMDGYEATIRLRSARHNPNVKIPIIALTASALLDERDKALQAGMDFHLTKPFTPSQLAVAIHQFFPADEKDPEQSSGLSLPDPFQLEEIAELYDGDWEHAQLMFELFAQTIPLELQKMENAVAAEDWENLGATAHKIKPNFRMVGCGSLGGPAQKLELLAREQPVDMDAIRPVWAEFHENVQALLPKIQPAIQQIEAYLKNSKHEMSDR